MRDNTTPAFPTNSFGVCDGMSLRTYIAVQAMSALLAKGYCAEAFVAKRAVEMADEMLKELEK